MASYKATLIRETVRESPLVHESQIPVLSYYVDLILHMQVILADIRAQMRELAKLTPNYNLLLSISKLGNANRFHYKKQLIAFAGISNRSNGASNRTLRTFYSPY